MVLAWAECCKDWLPIKIHHCTLSIYLSPLSAACSSYESGIEPMGMLGYNSESAITALVFVVFDVETVFIHGQ